MSCLQRGHLRSCFGMFSYLPVSIAKYVQHVLKRVKLSCAQQLLSSQGMFEIDNYESSLSDLDSYLFCLSLSNRGFVSNYLYIFVKTVLIVGLRLDFVAKRERIQTRRFLTEIMSASNEYLFEPHILKHHLKSSERQLV